MIKLPPMPKSIAALARDDRGYPVPWFVRWVDGKPVFPAADPRRLRRAINESRCWVCGGILVPAHAAFVIGPMCSVNRISAEPPSHIECCLFSVKACPFLARPAMGRVDIESVHGLTPQAPPGHMVEHNPGVAIIWRTPSWRVVPIGSAFLFELANPTEVTWWREGRPATRDEAQAALDKGLAVLAPMAEQAGPSSVMQLQAQLAEAIHFLPLE